VPRALEATRRCPAVRPGSPLLGAAWLLGALVLLAQVVWSGRRLNAELARQHAVVNPTVGEVLAEVQRRMEVRRVLPVVQSRAVGSPALMGFIRPWLLLPEGVAGGFTPAELRYVFLHELAHLKRRDILVDQTRSFPGTLALAGAGTSGRPRARGTDRREADSKGYCWRRWGPGGAHSLRGRWRRPATCGFSRGKYQRTAGSSWGIGR